MKTQILFFLILFPIIFCTCNSKITEEDFLTVETTTLVLPATVSSTKISCSSNAKIETNVQPAEWCTATVVDEGKAIVVYVSDNETAGQDRAAIITVTAGTAESVQIEVKQGSVAPFFDFQDTELQFGWKDAQRSLMVQTNVDFTAKSSEPSWCKTEISNSSTYNLVISVTANDTDENRTAEITITCDILGISKKVTVKQSLLPAWELVW